MTNIYSTIKFSLLMLFLVIFSAHQASAATISFDLAYDRTIDTGIALQTIGDSRPRCAENAEYDSRGARIYAEYKGQSGANVESYMISPHTTELRSTKGQKLTLTVSPLGFTRTASNKHGTYERHGGNYCNHVSSGQKLEYIEKSFTEPGEVWLKTYNNANAKYYMYAAFVIQDYKNLAPGTYSGNFAFTQSQVKFRTAAGKPWETVYATVNLVVTGHVFDVRFPYLSVATDPANLTWREIPIDIYTNESFKIRYWCRPSGVDEHGVNEQGFCKVEENGPALGVKLKFPHLNYDAEFLPDVWYPFDKEDFTIDNLAVKYRGFIGFKLQDIELGSPGALYISNPYFIVEADF